MLWTAFLWGFLGSFHCIGMCGPIALALAGKDRNKYLLNKLLYNSGRTLTYSLLGGLVGLLGFSLALAGIQQWLSILMGAVIIGMAFFYRKSEKWVSGSWLAAGMIRLKSRLGSSIKRGGPKAFFISGILNGFLPCGMVYMALLASLAMQGPVSGMVYMLFFGLGTIPVMVLLMLSKNIFSFGFRLKMNRLLPYFALFIGVLFVIRGMGWGIPFLSPALGFPKTEVTEMLDGNITHCD
ncbi:sulfite exporter TauE/SafE family protein [Cyclobacterium plantarum]|uniref:Sulfite exporter TauE/SafE family protein n=1 Tax=Cyclobacterium plantarum TaxID=2716263 RepID=A0ABX0H6U0_9BACT|nr:sulfite exporter TauE/SafE family protein [Cyclobacterium plantarum]NHE56147.1 sulfite exporter TauE/SafE family protein [Cyclobacterium plantarum]